MITECQNERLAASAQGKVAIKAPVTPSTVRLKPYGLQRAARGISNHPYCLHKSTARKSTTDVRGKPFKTATTNAAIKASNRGSFQPHAIPKSAFGNVRIKLANSQAYGPSARLNRRQAAIAVAATSPYL